ncbi:MAG: hypothetical protein IKF52_02060 [Clostridia bacterium]|nr:hypothetical protein [Clostridia bacterium]
MIETLICALILALFNFDNILIAGFNEVVGTHYTKNVYWLVAFIIGLIVEIIRAKNKKKS